MCAGCPFMHDFIARGWVEQFTTHPAYNCRQISCRRVIYDPTLFLLAPHSKNQPGTHYKDFYTILANGVGPDYGISSSLIQQVATGMPVIVFDRDRRLQPQGTVTGRAPTTKAGNGVQRYDVSIHGLTLRPYTNPPRVNRFGVGVY
jgi:hypothetical protein